MDSDATPGRETTDEQLLQAVKTIVELALGSRLDSVRGEVGRVESALDQRLKEGIAGVKGELAARKESLIRSIAEVTEAGKRARTDFEMRTEASLAESKKAFDELEERTEKRLITMKSALEKELASREENIRAELDSLATVMAHLESELRRQQESIEHVSAVLENLGSVFGKSPALNTASAPAQKQTTGSANAKPEPDPEIEVVLDKTI